MLFENESDAPSKAIVNQINNRLDEIFNAGIWPKFNEKKLARTKTFYEKQSAKTELKSNSSCGKKSRGANPLYYSNIKDLAEMYKVEEAKELTDGAALKNLIELYSVWMKQSLFNCYNMGYGSDPQDGSIDKQGKTCEKANQMGSFKCRFEFKQANFFNKFASDKLFQD